MANCLGIAGRVRFLTALTNQEVRDLLADCLAVLFTPMREPFGIVALEALAAGKPLVAVDEGGYTEVVDASCALLAPPQPAAIAEKLRLLRDNPTIACRMGRAGREIAGRYTWDRTAAELLAILEGTCESWRRQQPAPPGLANTEVPLIGVHYCCGYGLGLGSAGWPATLTDMPMLGYYPSWQGTILAEHLHTIQELGFDVVIPIVQLGPAGVNGHELVAIQRLFHIAEESGSPLRFALHLKLRQCRRKDLLDMLRLTRNILSRQNHYLHRHNRPVLFADKESQSDCDQEFAEHATDMDCYCL
jgi:hypothetical protein